MQTQTDKLQLVLKCALFMAEKSQRVSNLKVSLLLQREKK